MTVLQPSARPPAPGSGVRGRAVSAPAWPGRDQNCGFRLDRGPGRQGTGNVCRDRKGKPRQRHVCPKALVRSCGVDCIKRMRGNLNQLEIPRRVRRIRAGAKDDPILTILRRQLLARDAVSRGRDDVGRDQHCAAIGPPVAFQHTGGRHRGRLGARGSGRHQDRSDQGNTAHAMH